MVMDYVGLDTIILKYLDIKSMVSFQFHGSQSPIRLLTVSHYVSVNTIPPGKCTNVHVHMPMHVLTARGRVGFSPNFLCPGGWGFELEKVSTGLKEKCRNFFKETGGSLKGRCSCAVSCQYLQKQ